ncbi:hypothetical protein SDC9_196968 [bioreactor metagenome]|uniref:Uncharacterized protein n=1 Tax=bioreactor metagenome TaxID=1076179 RepID=A0A645IE03_9ZZZZ
MDGIALCLQQLFYLADEHIRRTVKPVGQRFMIACSASARGDDRAGCVEQTVFGFGIASVNSQIASFLVHGSGSLTEDIVYFENENGLTLRPYDCGKKRGRSERFCRSISSRQGVALSKSAVMGLQASARSAV